MRTTSTRPINWVKAALKDFDAFPSAVKLDGLRALTVAADGGVMEIVLKHRGDAFRVVYAVQIGDDIWVVHAFQKKSTQGIKTPKREIDLVHERLKRLKEMLT